MKFIFSFFILLLTISSSWASNYEIERIRNYLNNVDDILIIQRGTFSFGFSRILNKGLFILSIQKETRKTNEYSPIYNEYLLDSIQIEDINEKILATNLNELKEPKEISDYNFNWLDCPSTKIQYETKNLNYDCLDGQNTKELVKVKELIKLIELKISLKDRYKFFHQSLPKGRYRSGMVKLQITNTPR